MDQHSCFDRHFRSAFPRRASVVFVALLAFVCCSSTFGSEIHDAAKAGDLAKVQALLKDNPAQVCSKDSKGLTPLHQAGAYGHDDVTALLLDSHACVDAKAIDGSTPLHSAAAHGHTAVARLLLAAQADVNARTNAGLTPLHLAALLDHPDVAILLLDNHADVNAKSGAGVGDDNGKGIHVVSAMLGAGFTVPHGDSYGGGATPLHLAAMSGYKELAEILLAHGADINARNSSGKTPLQLAKTRRAMVDFLRQHGATQ